MASEFDFNDEAYKGIAAHARRHGTIRLVAIETVDEELEVAAATLHEALTDDRLQPPADLEWCREQIEQARIELGPPD